MRRQIGWKDKTEADWLTLEGHLADRWQRGQCCEAEIELVKRRGKPRKG